MKITGEELIKKLKADPETTVAFLVGCKPDTVFDLVDPPVLLTQQQFETLADRYAEQQKLNRDHDIRFSVTQRK